MKTKKKLKKKELPTTGVFSSFLGSSSLELVSLFICATAAEIASAANFCAKSISKRYFQKNQLGWSLLCV
jgi:hypothetical protein